MWNVRLICLAFALSGYTKAQVQADFVLYQAKIYDGKNAACQECGLAIKNGKIAAIGPDKVLKKTIKSSFWVPLKGQVITPGLIDPHSHFTQAAQMTLELDLRGVPSEEAMLDSLKAYARRNPKAQALVGRGWDQNLWPGKKEPHKNGLDRHFPNQMVWLVRVDGHAALANQYALNKAGLTDSSSISGGQLVRQNGELTGLLVDGAMEAVRPHLPKPSEEALLAAMKALEQELFAEGLTGVSDLGLEAEGLERLENLYQNQALEIRMYAYASPSLENLVHWLNRGPWIGSRLSIRGFKFYMDGAFGSRGAWLTQPYADEPGHFGLALLNPDSIAPVLKALHDAGFQLATHCIGDAALVACLQAYQAALSGAKDHRARLEHLQLAEGLKGIKDLDVLASVQPRHAVSDADWVPGRLGPDRLAHAYPLKRLEAAGIRYCLGTDFPVEPSQPLATFRSATLRKLEAKEADPPDWLAKEALSPLDALAGMTSGAAYAQFQEGITGSLEPGLAADLVVWNADWPANPSKNAQVWVTFLEGEPVFWAKDVLKKHPVLADLLASIKRVNR